MIKILLTGATGFVGKYLESSNSGQFRCVIRKEADNFFSDYFIIDSLNKLSNWTGAFTDIHTIVHLAGLAHSKSFTEQDYQSINVEGTLHLALEAAKAGVKRFVFVSSIGVNGTSTAKIPFLNSNKNKPHNAYAQSKLDAEIGLKKIAAETGIELVIVRPTLVYGPNAPGNFGALVRLVSKLPCLPFGLINNKRDFISVQNLASLLITCAKHPNAAGHTFLASDSETVSIQEFTNAIAEGLGKKVIQLPFPICLMRLGGSLLGKSAMVEQLVGNLQVDSKNLKKILNWTPPYTMKESMAFFKHFN
jgi:nucleoside-diphosphate-sugar epimerase